MECHWSACLFLVKKKTEIFQSKMHFVYENFKNKWKKRVNLLKIEILNSEHPIYPLERNIEIITTTNTQNEKWKMNNKFNLSV